MSGIKWIWTCRYNIFLNFFCVLFSVADPGCLSRIRFFFIPDPNCLHPGSASNWSTCFWATWIRIYQSEVWIRLRIRIWILLSQSKKSKKNYVSFWIVTFFDLLSWKVMYMYLQNVICKKSFLKISFFLASWEGQWRKLQDQDPEPDPFVGGMDPRIQIRIRIHQQCFEDGDGHALGRQDG